MKIQQSHATGSVASPASTESCVFHHPETLEQQAALSGEILDLHLRIKQSVFGTRLNQFYRATALILEMAEEREVREAEAYHAVSEHFADEINGDPTNIYLNDLYVGACEEACDLLGYRTQTVFGCYAVRLANAA